MMSSSQSTAVSAGSNVLASAPSHNVKPGRRRNHACGFRISWTHTQILSLALLVILALCATSEARSIERVVEKRFPEAQKGEILVDRSTQPRVDLHANNVLAKRQTDDPLNIDKPTPSSSSSSSSASTKATARFSASAKATPSSSTTVTSSSASSTSTPSSSSSSNGPSLSSPLPQPFDNGLGNNFTAPSCPDFFKSFLNDQVFKSCVPFSLLLQNSQSFFRATKDSEYLDKVLDASCNVISAACVPLMASLSGQITAEEHCGSDFQLQNPYVVSAYWGFVSYEAMFKAACTKASSSADGGSSADYCFTAASEIGAEPADAYIYSLPLEVNLPGSSRPTCSECVKKTMTIFSEAAQNLTSPLSRNYVQAATQVNSGCGPNFVPSSIKPIQGSDTRIPGAAAGLVRVGLGSLMAGVVGAVALLL